MHIGFPFTRFNPSTSGFTVRVGQDNPVLAADDLGRLSSRIRIEGEDQ